MLAERDDSRAQRGAGYQARVLEALASAANYRAWLCDLAFPYLGPDPLEVASGLGDYADEWLIRGLTRITVSEADLTLMRRLEARFAGDPRVTVAEIDVTRAPPGSHSSVVAFNVLEHIADDAGALRGMAGLVRRGGAVVVFVPAVPAAMSRFDRRIGHLRRYTRRSLSAALISARLSIERMDYVNAPGLAAWFIGMRLLRMAPAEGPVLTAWDRLVVPVARSLEARVRPPIGQSLFAVGRVSPR